VHRLRRFTICFAVGLVFASCGSDANGLPKGVSFGNWTSTQISIRLKASGSVLVNTVDPHHVAEINVLMTDHGAPCVGDKYLALDANGNEVAERDSGQCDSWLVAVDPIPVSITNDTSTAVDVIYRHASEQVLKAGLGSGQTLMGTVQQFGDPSELCLSGWLIARPASHPDIRVDIATCATWQWQTGSTPLRPTGSDRPTPS
jgi:hypothetical protein